MTEITVKTRGTRYNQLDGVRGREVERRYCNQLLCWKAATNLETKILYCVLEKKRHSRKAWLGALAATI